uniref:Uncharacterized protein n=1 Tax=Globodera rostochiensis TaxID=31243 RepID=A0A914HNT7_GLORO
MSLLSLSQLNNNSKIQNGGTLDGSSSFPQPTLLSSNGICQLSSTTPATVSATVSDGTHNNSFDNAKQARGSSTVVAEQMPMDLSYQQSMLHPTTDNLAPGFVPQTRKACDIRRSASSVSYKGNADVHEHFQRTFSGKWPRRQPSLRSHLQLSGGRAAVAKKETALSIGESAAETDAEGSGVGRTEEPMEEEEESVERRSKLNDSPGSQSPEERAPPPEAQIARPKSRQQVKSVYTAVIRKLFTSNEVKQVEDHFRKSLGEDRFQQIKNEQQRKQREEQLGNDEDKLLNVVRF